VGKFWTEMCVEHVFHLVELHEFAMGDWFKDQGIRFGKGLQLVNILRDLPKDLRNGRCYLPLEKLAEAGLTPEDLLQPANEGKFRPLYNSYLDLAESHLAAGWQYTNCIMWGQIGLRLACAWPILIGARTIEKLRAAGVAELQQRVKVSRGEVRGIIARSVLLYPFPGAWRNQFQRPAHGKAVASDGKLA
jgi:farnesyl-diphosphate farnesyltransferase